MADDNESLIFERAIIQNNNNDTIVVRFTAQGETGITLVSPQSIVIAEAFSYGSPVISMTFVDGDGVYTNLLKMSTESVYWLSFSDGNTRKTMQRIPLRISKIESTNSNNGRSDQVVYKISFLHSGWNDFMNVRVSRGWGDTKYSDIVADVVSGIGYSTVNISPSRGTPENVIQPHWPNHMFIKWLQERAVSEKYDDHFEFSCRSNNEFFFKSISDLIDESSKMAEEGKIPLLKLGGQEPEENREDTKDENFTTPTYFTHFSATEYYSNSVINGAGGVQAMNYDFESGRFHRTEVTQSGSNALQLSDWGSIKKVDENTRYKMFGGRDVETVNKAIARVSSVAISTNQFSISTEASLSTRVGHLVELIVPSSKKMVTPFSVIYSGFYIVSGVTHVINLGESTTMATKLDLSRHGFDGADLDGYIKTRSGKFVGDREVKYARVDE